VNAMDENFSYCDNLTQQIQEYTSDTFDDGRSKVQKSLRPWGRLLSTDMKFCHVDLMSNEILLGREGVCSVIFNDMRVSARHCRVFRNPSKMGSSFSSSNAALSAFSRFQINDTRVESVLKNQKNDNNDNTERKSDLMDTKNQPQQEKYDVYVEDLSSNGTYWNGKKIGRGNRVLVKNGDEISLVASSGNIDCVVTYMFQDLSVKKENDFQEMGEITEDYCLQQVIGTGSFSVVKLGIHRKTGLKVAIKTIDKIKYWHRKTMDQIQREVDILKQLKHDNIISIVEIYSTNRFLHLVLEYASGGELFESVVNKGYFSEDEARSLFIQMLHAVQYLHSRDIVHRDLKPENILFENKESNRIKITDFGLARIVGAREMMSTICGTPQYIAPEVIYNSSHTQKEYNQKSGYGKEVDMWSLGGILYLLLSGFLPFDEEREIPLCEQIHNGLYDFPQEFWGEISMEAKDLVTKLLTVDPRKRMTVEEALQHQWITGKAMLSSSLEISPPREAMIPFVPTIKEAPGDNTISLTKLKTSKSSTNASLEIAKENFPCNENQQTHSSQGQQKLMAEIPSLKGSALSPIMIESEHKNLETEEEHQKPPKRRKTFNRSIPHDSSISTGNSRKDFSLFYATEEIEKASPNGTQNGTLSKRIDFSSVIAETTHS